MGSGAGVFGQFGGFLFHYQPAKATALLTPANLVRSAGGPDADDAEVGGVKGQVALAAANLPTGGIATHNRQLRLSG